MKYMKKVSDSRMMQLSFGVLGLIAGAGLAAGYMTFAGYSRQIETNEHNTELTQLMVEAVHSDQLLRRLNNAEQEQAKVQLKSALAYELAAIRSLAPATDKPRQDGAKALLAEIGREQHAHPEYYLASYRKTGVDQSGDMQVVQH
jgi:hypothetical protein